MRFMLFSRFAAGVGVKIIMMLRAGLDTGFEVYHPCPALALDEAAEAFSSLKPYVVCVHPHRHSIILISQQPIQRHI
jgi:hypothetical protein